MRRKRLVAKRIESAKRVHESSGIRTKRRKNPK
jgi:hypothetical protein